MEDTKPPKTIASDTPSTKGGKQSNKVINLAAIILMGIIVALICIFLPSAFTEPITYSPLALLGIPLGFVIIAIIVIARINKNR